MRVPVSAQTKRLRGEVKDMKRTDADDDEVRFHRDAGAAGAVPGEVHACSCMHLCVRVWSPALHASVHVLFFICGGRTHACTHIPQNTHALVTLFNNTDHLRTCTSHYTMACMPVCICARLCLFAGGWAGVPYKPVSALFQPVSTLYQPCISPYQPVSALYQPVSAGVSLVSARISPYQPCITRPHAWPRLHACMYVGVFFCV